MTAFAEPTIMTLAQNPIASGTLPSLCTGTNAHIARIESARLESLRPRHAGSNARLGEHGLLVRVPLVRITDSDGASGFGVARLTKEQAETWINAPLSGLFDKNTDAVSTEALPLEFPLYDWAGKRAQKPVYALWDDTNASSLEVPCYDTSLYFDDLHITDDIEATALITNEARDGYERGHRAFKIKVGRGARHMELEKGTRRDIAIIRAVREAVGADCPLMIDANNGYNLNLTKRVLEETADCRLFWLEEAFHEDPVLYRDLKEWMQTRGINTKIAEGEGEASPSLQAWAFRDGLIDVLQYDVFWPGFTFWLELGQRLVEHPAVSAAPHHYGMHLGNYVTGHLARRVPRLLFLEWDEAQTPALDGSAYHVHEGRVTLPSTPGFGLHLDEALWNAAVRENGFIVG